MGVGSYLSKISLRSPFTTKSTDSITLSDSAAQLLTLPSTSYISAGTPSWRNLSELTYLLKCYKENPVVQTIIDVKAKAWSNMKFSVKDIKSGEIIPLEDYDKDQGKLRDLIDQPNPLQSTSEWLMQSKVNLEVFGNMYKYASVPDGWENNFTYEDINAINNLPPYCVAPILTGKWLEATTKDEIIKEYKFSDINGEQRLFPTNQIFHANTVNITFDKNFTEGVSHLIALQKSISNIDVAFESLNVLLRERGALGMITSDKKDEALGSLPLNNDELELVQNQFKEHYGLRDGQWSQIISPMPLKYTKMGMNVKELGILEGIAVDVQSICHKYGVPESLVPYYIKKGGLAQENNNPEKRLYDSTIIPESSHYLKNLNNFLKTKEHGIQLLGSFDHLKVLQTNQKEEADTNKINEETSRNIFKMGGLTYGEYLSDTGRILDDSALSNLRIWDLDEKQLQAIGITTNTGNNGENNGESKTD